MTGSVLAQNGSTPGTMELYPTFEAIGVRLPYAGDLNGNAVAHVEWRRGGVGAWTRGVDMARIPGPRWAASVLFLDDDTAYEVRAVIEDPDGGGSATGSIRTRKLLPTAASGRTFWVSVGGNDGGAGTSVDPLGTLQEAAERVQPGDEIRVRPGIYYQNVVPAVSGTAVAPIHLVANGPGVILDGSDPALLHRSDWRNDGGGVFSIPFTGLTRLVCADSLGRLYHHDTLAALQSGANGITQGWVIEAGRLWVRLENGSSPVGHTMHIARFHVGAYVETSYWRIQGFEIRYYGTESGTGAGISFWGATGCEITDNYVHTIGGHCIFLRGSASNLLIERNHCLDGRISTWPWSAIKSHWEDRSAVSNRGGRGNVIRYNTIQGVFNGIDTVGSLIDENVAADCDIQENSILEIGDDAIENDDLAGINLRVWKNRLDRCYVGISIAPIYAGPEYVLYNTIVEYGRSGFKHSVSSLGFALVAHNTVSTTETDKAAVHPSGPYSNVHFRNNILVGKVRACVSDDAGESLIGNDFNGDLVHADYSTLFRWKGINYSTLAALRSGTGFEANGRSGDPRFNAPEAGDYTLRPESPAIDGALRLAGVNDAYEGLAPDMGAHERAGETATVGTLESIQDEDGSLVLRWSVARAVGGSRFHVWRAPRPAGDSDHQPTPDAVRLTQDPVGPTEPNGAEYAYRDAVEPSLAFAYWVEDERGDYLGPWIAARGANREPSLRALSNPFRDSVRLAWAVPAPTEVTLRIFDVKGRLIRSLVDRQPAERDGEWIWGGEDDTGRPVATGFYWARMQTASGDRRTVRLLRLP